MLLQSVLSKLAEAGLATKAAAGGAAVVVAASAAGAADALPEPAQDAFDRLTVEETVEVDDQGVEDGTFGARVSSDATGESDGEPGVDGATIACEASEGRSGTCDESTEDLDSTDDEGPEEGSFGERVSQDATGESDGEPGVDGREIADEAKANGDDVDTADTDTDDDDGGPEGTPGEAAIETHRPGGDA